MEGNIPTLLDCKTCLINNFISANTELLNIHNVTCKPNKIASLIKALKIITVCCSMLSWVYSWVSEYTIE